MAEKLNLFIFAIVFGASIANNIPFAPHSLVDEGKFNVNIFFER